MYPRHAPLTWTFPWGQLETMAAVGHLTNIPLLVSANHGMCGGLAFKGSVSCVRACGVCPSSQASASLVPCCTGAASVLPSFAHLHPQAVGRACSFSGLAPYLAIACLLVPVASIPEGEEGYDDAPPDDMPQVRAAHSTYSRGPSMNGEHSGTRTPPQQQTRQPPISSPRQSSRELPYEP